MKLLFDENLSSRLVASVGAFYPGSVHVSHVGLAGAPDQAIWAHAAAAGFVLVTKDEDFQRLSVLLGPPPKVIWIRLGNCSTADVGRILLMRIEQIALFVDHEDAAFLALG